MGSVTSLETPFHLIYKLTFFVPPSLSLFSIYLWLVDELIDFQKCLQGKLYDCHKLSLKDKFLLIIFSFPKTKHEIIKTSSHKFLLFLVMLSIKNSITTKLKINNFFSIKQNRIRSFVQGFNLPSQRHLHSRHKKKLFSSFSIVKGLKCRYKIHCLLYSGSVKWREKILIQGTWKNNCHMKLQTDFLTPGTKSINNFIF